MRDLQTAEPTRLRLLAYALPALPLAVLTLPFYVMVPQFYAESLGLSLAHVGQALLIVRLIDAATDPIVGVWADRTRPAFGRRRAWLALAAPLIAVSAFMVLAPGPGAGTTYLVAWGTLLSIGWTCALVPYSAWGAELSTSYAGRTRVAAYRETAVVLGTLLAIVAAALVPGLGWGGDREVLYLFALVVAVGVPATTAVALAVLPEPPDRSRRRVPFREGLGFLAGNAPFRRLLSAYFINGLANGLPATLFLFFVADRLQAPSLKGPLLLLYFLFGLAGVPLWLWLAGRQGKHRAWCIAMILACLAFAIAPFLGAGNTALFAVVCIVTGLALGADLVLPASLQADAIDIDTARSGEQRSALYLALWGLATKLALALAVGIAFPLLAWAGFDPAAGRNDPAGLSMLAFLYAGAPVGLKLVAIALMWRFPIDRTAQAELAAAISDGADQSVLPVQPVALATAGK